MGRLNMTFTNKDPIDELTKVRELEIALSSKRDKLKQYNNPLLKDNISITVELYDQIAPGTQRMELKYNNDTIKSCSRKKRLAQLIVSFIEDELAELEDKIKTLYKDISQ